jgi:hypothetical protein
MSTLRIPYISVYDLLRQVARRLVDHLYVADHGVDGLLVSAKGCPGHALSLCRNAADGFQNVPQP